jgi:hypothetical protein
MTGWPQLPAEVRRIIFDYLSPESEWPVASYQRAHCATVCKEWQFQFEQQNFKVLALDQGRFQDFIDIVSCNERRRRAVQRIILRIKLDEYDCSICESEEDKVFTPYLPMKASDLASVPLLVLTLYSINRNDKVFFETIWRFLHILSTWEKRCDLLDKGDHLTLDLGVYSPSDGEHAFREMRFTKGFPHIPGYFIPKGLAADYKCHEGLLLESSDTCPGWAHSRLGEASTQARKRLLSTVGHPKSVYARKIIKLCITEFGELPMVEALTGLEIRRHYFRHISLLMLRMMLEKSLINIHRFRHEKWRGIDEDHRLALETGKSNRRAWSGRTNRTPE